MATGSKPSTSAESGKSTIKDDDLETLARVFDAALRGCIDASDPVLGDYPHGCCGSASEMLGTWLLDEHGIQVKIVSAEREIVGKPWTHAWLQVDGTILDLTCSQFSDWTDQCPYVGRSTQWHARWSVRSVQSITVEDESPWHATYAAVQRWLALKVDSFTTRVEGPIARSKAVRLPTESRKRSLPATRTKTIGAIVAEIATEIRRCYHFLGDIDMQRYIARYAAMRMTGELQSPAVTKAPAGAVENRMRVAIEELAKGRPAEPMATVKYGRSRDPRGRGRGYRYAMDDWIHSALREVLKAAGLRPIQVNQALNGLHQREATKRNNLWRATYYLPIRKNGRNKKKSR